MPAVARFALMLMVVLFSFSVAGSSATASAVRTAIPEPSVGASTLTTSPPTPPRQSRPTREVTEKKVVAWILLLMKEGPGAR
jgi:hypothetical protein